MNKELLTWIDNKIKWCEAKKDIRLNEVMGRYNMNKDEALDWMENNKDYEHVQRNSEIMILEEIKQNLNKIFEEKE